MKVDLEGTPFEIFSELKKQSGNFLSHEYTKRQQAACANELREKVDGVHIVLQVDFSENASLGYQNEIQSVHWNHRQATLFTCYAWISPEVNESIVIIWDDLTHTKLSVYAYMTRILDIIVTKYPSVKSIDIFSDGAASQFKQKYLFSNLHTWETKFEISLQWNFFATSHGKGVVDGIGGAVKRSVW